MEWHCDIVRGLVTVPSVIDEGSRDDPEECTAHPLQFHRYQEIQDQIRTNCGMANRPLLQTVNFKRVSKKESFEADEWALFIASLDK